MDPLAGKTANTPRLEPVSTLRQRIAERARHALGMAWVIFIASWTNGYATARSEAICRGAGCGRTRTSGSVGGQGQQRPWSTRPRRAGGCSRTQWLDPILGRETVDQPGHIGLIGEVGHAPRPRAPAAAWPAHERPGGRVPGPCRLATGPEGRVARIVDDQGLIAIGVDRSV